ncbi:unnamed protein product, partial [Brassica rapa subsp. narinosa]
MVLKDSIEEMFPIWLGEDDDPQLVRLITDIHSGRFVRGLWKVQGNAKGKGKGKGNEKKRMKGGVSSEAEPPTKKQKKVKTQNESEADAAGKGSSETEGSKELELENKATLTTIVSTLDIISRKFDQFDSRLEAYELDRNIPLMDQKTIDDKVNALLEERLKDLGIGKISENHDNPSPPLSDNSLSKASPVVRTHQKSINSPALVAATPGPKRNLAKELEKESGVKRALDDEFGSVAKATDMQPLDFHEGANVLDFLYVSPAKATKAEDLRRRSTRNRTIKDEDAEDKKKAVQAEAVLKKKEKAAAKRKAAASMKQKQPDQELIRSAIVKEYREKMVKLSPQGFVLSEGSSRPVFPYIGDNGTTCMRNNVEPSSAIYDPIAPVDPIVLDKLMQHISRIPPKPPAPAKKRVVRSAAREGDFYSILILERPKKFAFRRMSKRYTPQNTQIGDCGV